jgi:hypothetical protein
MQTLLRAIIAQDAPIKSKRELQGEPKDRLPGKQNRTATQNNKNKGNFMVIYRYIKILN